MDYQGFVLYSVEGGYLVLRMVATVSAVPIYARAGGPFGNVETALAYGDRIAETEL